MIQSISSFILCIGSLFLPHSPRWLEHVGRAEDAKRAWAKLGYTDTEVEKELEVEARERVGMTIETDNANRANAEAVAHGGKPDRFQGTVWGRDVRRRTILGIFLYAMQQVQSMIFVEDFSVKMF